MPAVTKLLLLVLVEVPLFLFFSVIVATYSIEYFRDEYILPQIVLHSWNKRDETRRQTYYNRLCNENDISTSDRNDIILTDDMDEDDALQLFNIHGTILMRDMLSPETAAELRAYILLENERRNDTVEVFNPKNRWSFTLDIDEHPIVAKAAAEILSNERYIRVIEKIVGPNPAVIEFTMVSSAPGAKRQEFHTDSGTGASRFARSFFPALSLFTALQNTTRGMGATEICPGTHHCYEEYGLKDCAKWGRKHSILTGDDDNWPVGWAALTSQQTMHRGGGHSAKYSPHRVMFYFTFAPRPRWGPYQLETRSFAIGGTKGQKWHQWGHTLRDYQNPTKYMAMPWRLLRAWGLYLPSGRQWGWDYWAVATSYAFSKMDKYAHVLGPFEDMLTLDGGYPYLPKFLHADYNVAHEYETNSEEITDDKLFLAHFGDTVKRVRMMTLRCYLCFLSIFALFGVAVPRRTTRGWTTAVSSFRRLALSHSTLVIVVFVLFFRFKDTSWAKSVKRGRLYTLSNQTHLLPDLPSTTPNRDDILILDDLRSDYLGYLSTVFDTFHPGNKAFGELVASRARGFASLTPALRNHLCEDVLRWSRQQHRRVLRKNKVFDYAVAEAEWAFRFCHKEMMKLSSSVLREIIVKVDNLFAETKFGFWRETRLHQQHIPLFLLRLQDQVMRFSPLKRSELSLLADLPSNSRNEAICPFHRVPIFRASLPSNRASFYTPRTNILSQEAEIERPHASTWSPGQIVDACDGDELSYWYRATLLRIESQQFHVVHDANPDADDDDNEFILPEYCVIPFVPYAKDEIVQCLYSIENGYVPARVLQVYPDKDVYDLALLDAKGNEAEFRYSVAPYAIRRVISDSYRESAM